MNDQIPLLLAAMMAVESNNGRYLIGDNGQSIGPYQISYAYWKDARVPGSYKQCMKKEYSEQVIKNYWKRYAPQAYKYGDVQTLARIHNGGPRGHMKPQTIKYWKKVHAKMDRHRR